MESQVATFAEALDNVLGEHLSILGEKEAVVSNNFGYCGDCKTTMVLKLKTKKKETQPDNYLLWCNECSLCLTSLPYPGSVTDAKSKCTTCGFGKSTGGRNSDWTMCPKCSGEATPAVDVVVARCLGSNCSSKRMSLEQKSGKWQLCCSGNTSCGYVLNMPKSTKSVMVRVDGGQHRMCGECKRVPKFQVVLDGRMPPGEDNQYTRCLKCDEFLRYQLSGWYEKRSANGGGGGGGNRGGGGYNGRGRGRGRGNSTATRGSSNGSRSNTGSSARGGYGGGGGRKKRSTGNGGRGGRKTKNRKTSHR